MAWRIFPNGATNYLSANITTTSATTLTLTDATAFPAPAAGQEYSIRIDNEFLLVTGKSSNTLTVVRGASGSTATTHAQGAMVYTVVNSADFDKMSKQVNLETTSGAPASPTYATPLQMAFDPSTSTLYIWNGSAWKSVVLS